MPTKKILVTSDDIYVDIIRDTLKDIDVEIHVCRGNPTFDQVRAKLQELNGVDAILFSGEYFSCDSGLFDAAGPQFGLLSVISTGYDYVDLAELRRRGIKLTNTRDTANDAVANHAIALALAASRRLHESRLLIEKHEWMNHANEYQWLQGEDITGSTVGIVGLGKIGQITAKRVRAFDIAKLVYCDLERKPEADSLGAEFKPLDELLAISDFVFVHVTLNSTSYKLFNRDQFTLMKKSAVFVNTARGCVVDTDALYDALVSKRIFAAGLDVVDPEPIGGDHKLCKLRNVILTPHRASSLKHVRQAMTVLASKNIRAYLLNEPLLTEVIN